MKFLVTFLAIFRIITGFSQCTASGQSLVTSYVSNNSNKGEMFDIVAANTVTLFCFDLNLILGSNSSYEVYYKAGSYVGSENNAAAWTLAGSNPSVPCVGFDSPSPLNIPLNLVIPAGQTYGFYVTCTNVASTGGIRYTNNGGYTNVAADANITIAGGIGKAYPFSTNYNNRSFNGTVHYANGSVLPVQLSSFSALAVERNVNLSWTTQAEINNDHFTLERSANLSDWEFLENVKGAGNSEQEISYIASDNFPLRKTAYYRLSQTDTDGKTKVLSTQSVSAIYSHEPSEKLIVSPNPASAIITVYEDNIDLQEIQLIDMYGRDVFPLTTVVRENNVVTIDVSRIQSGSLIISAGNKSALFIRQ